jgi:hypothetical protein
MVKDRKVIEVLQSLASLDLKHWTGLVQGTTLDHARQVFEVDEEWRGAGRLGSEGRKVEWYSVEAEGLQDGLRLWFTGNDLLMADARRPRLPVSVDELLASMGMPQARLDSYLGTLLIEKSEWVFADRGLTVFVNPPNHRLLRIAVYAPLGLDDYRAGLRLNLKRVRLPVRRHRVEGITR